MKNVQEILESLLIEGDIVKEVEPTTEKHYSLNLRYEVIRNDKTYFISIKEVNVFCSEKKDHVRIDVDTDLPRKEKPKTKKQLKIEELREKLKIAKEKKIKWQIFQYTHDLRKLGGL
jgi:hypothetical protein